MKPVRKVACVIPSNRVECLKLWLSVWKPFPWDDTIVVWDGPRPSWKYKGQGTLLSWEDADRLDPKREVFSRKDSAIRCLGYLEAVRRGANYILTLDDDCFPDDKTFFLQDHVRNLNCQPAWITSVPGETPRGLPYEAHYRYGQAVLSVGLWKGNADLDAVTTLNRMKHGPLLDFCPPPEIRIMSPHQWFPMSGMNLMFRKELLPAMYYPPMGEGSPYSRFDDIWCGLVVQKVMAAMGQICTVGRPFVRHIRASNPYRNLKKEAAGIGANEWVWKLIKDVSMSLYHIPGSVLDVANHLEMTSGLTPDPIYIQRWATGLRGWVRLAEVAWQEAEASGQQAPPARS